MGYSVAADNGIAVPAGELVCDCQLAGSRSPICEANQTLMEVLTCVTVAGAPGTPGTPAVPGIADIPATGQSGVYEFPTMVRIGVIVGTALTVLWVGWRETRKVLRAAAWSSDRVTGRAAKERTAWQNKARR